MNPFNAKKRSEEIGKLLDKYIPAVAQMETTLKKYNVAFTTTTKENKKLKKENVALEKQIDETSRTSVAKKLEDANLRRNYEEARSVLDRIPKEVIDAYTRGQKTTNLRREER